MNVENILNVNIEDLKNKIIKARTETTKARTEPKHRKHIHITLNKMGMDPKLARLMNRDTKKKRKS